ncbi:MAG: formylglycine-generating enzyme family protein, partial [Myxococcota bacterium]
QAAPSSGGLATHGISRSERSLPAVPQDVLSPWSAAPSANLRVLRDQPLYKQSPIPSEADSSEDEVLDKTLISQAIPEMHSDLPDLPDFEAATVVHEGVPFEEWSNGAQLNADRDFKEHEPQRHFHDTHPGEIKVDSYPFLKADHARKKTFGLRTALAFVFAIVMGSAGWWFLAQNRHVARGVDYPEIFGMEVPMVKVPRGPLFQGLEEKNKAHSPGFQVHLETFWIDTFEVTVAQYQECVQAKKCSSPPGMQLEKQRQYPNRPVVRVTWGEASRFCAWAGKRLPAESEWEKAARGQTKSIYPWTSTQELKCEFANIFTCAPRHLRSVGPKLRAKGKSLYGAYDMIGNAREWVLDCYDSKFYTKRRRSMRKGKLLLMVNRAKSKRRCARYSVRGGSFREQRLERLTTYYRGARRSGRYRDVGFRCAWDPAR